MTAWIIIIVAVLGSYLLVRHFVGGVAIIYLAIVCWLLWHNRHGLSRFASGLQSRVDALDKAEIPTKKAAPGREYDYRYRKKSPSGAPLPIPDPLFAPRPERPVLTGSFLKKPMGEITHSGANLPVWFKESSKTAADLRRLKPKEFEEYAARNSLDSLGSMTVGEYLKSKERVEVLTGDDFMNNLKKLKRSGKIAELDKAAPRLSDEWLRMFYQLQPKSVRRVFTEEEFVRDASGVEYGLGEEERRDRRLVESAKTPNRYVLSGQQERDQERREKELREKAELDEQRRAREERREALIEQYQREDSAVQALAYELRKKGDIKAADDLINEHYRKWNSIS